MTDQRIRQIVALVLGGVYVGLLGYSVFGYSGSDAADPEDEEQTQTRPPRVLYHDDDVDVYQRRSVRSNNQRGGGLRGGK